MIKKYGQPIGIACDCCKLTFAISEETRGNYYSDKDESVPDVWLCEECSDEYEKNKAADSTN